MAVFLNGEWFEEKEAKVSVFDSGFLYGDGVYEAMRTYNGKLFRPEANLERLRKGLAALEIGIEFRDAELMEWISEGVKRNGYDETRVRVTVTRGIEGVATVCIQFEEIEELVDEYLKGVSVLTFDAERSLPGVKTISIASVMLARIERQKKGVFEVFLVNREGRVTEGTVSNFFLVKDGEVITPGQDILEGTTRSLIMELGWEVKEADVVREDLYGADEIFMTNAIKGVVPVVEIDGKSVADGKPGVVTKEVMVKFKDFVSSI